MEARQSASEEQVPDEARGRGSGHLLQRLHLARRSGRDDVRPAVRAPEQRKRAPAGHLQSLRQHPSQDSRAAVLYL